MSALLHEPAGGFCQKPDADQEEAAWDELNGDGDAPLFCGFGDVEGDAVVEPGCWSVGVREGRRVGFNVPVSERAANDEKLLEETRDAATDCRRAVLRNEDRRDARHASNADTCNDSASVDLTDGMVCGRLDGSPDQENEGEGHERVATTKLLVCDRSADGAEEATSCEQRDDVGGDLGVLGVCEAALGGREAEVFLEAREREHASHDPGVITFG